jgi:hypothetical protein
VANLTLSPSRRDVAGHAVHPVARVRVTLPVLAGHADAAHHCALPDVPTVLRVTLRSDGAVLRQVHIPATDWTRAHWTAHRIVAHVDTLRIACDVPSTMALRLATWTARRWPSATVTPEVM